jgi:DNA (cytosine-5)-methyltransferase 1
MSKIVKIIDLFAGLGGTRIGFTEACKKFDIEVDCVLTSEIKEHAVKGYCDNFINEKLSGDITKINPNDIPDFDYLLGGFPCQPFSSAGKRLGFYDTRGTLFFNIEQILATKKPQGFILENVEGILNHDKGETIKVIINNLEKLGYKVSFNLLDSSKFGVPQRRKRVYIVGDKDRHIDLENFTLETKKCEEILEQNLPVINNKFTKLLLGHLKASELYGKAIKDKRGGANNIHCWDFGLKGEVNKNQKYILNYLLKERRKKHWAIVKKIEWMDGMPLTLSEISNTVDMTKLSKDCDIFKELEDLVLKNYLVFEYPKKVIVENNHKKRVYDENGEKGYNIVTGKLSFDFNLILDPNGISPTLVATDANKIGVVDKKGIRKLSIREGLRMFGFPDSYILNLPHAKAFDLIGNSIVVPVVSKITERLVGGL